MSLGLQKTLQWAQFSGKQGRLLHPRQHIWPPRRERQLCWLWHNCCNSHLTGQSKKPSRAPVIHQLISALQHWRSDDRKIHSARSILPKLPFWGWSISTNTGAWPQVPRQSFCGLTEGRRITHSTDTLTSGMSVEWRSPFPDRLQIFPGSVPHWTLLDLLPSRNALDCTVIWEYISWTQECASPDWITVLLRESPTEYYCLTSK